MKKEQRLVYLVLAEAVNCQLCGFCRYGQYERTGCCEGYPYCNHPIDKLGDQEMEPGQDCWGFSPSISITLLADLAGAILSQGYMEWAYKRYSRTAGTVYGRFYQNGEERSGKVRIGHDGKPRE